MNIENLEKLFEIDTSKRNLEIYLNKPLNIDFLEKNPTKKIAEKHPTSPLAERYGKRSVKDTQIDNIIKKHRAKKAGKKV